jgi:hypothetical protein
MKSMKGSGRAGEPGGGFTERRSPSGEGEQRRETPRAPAARRDGGPRMAGSFVVSANLRLPVTSPWGRLIGRSKREEDMREMGYAKFGSVAGPAGLLIALTLGTVLANGRAMAAGEAADLFDAPISVQRLEPEAAGETSEIVCTQFDDLTIREEQEGPTSKPAGLIAAGGTCGRAETPGETKVKSAGMYFLGRKGPALVFEEMDPHGASAFVVVDSDTGTIVFRDRTFGAPAFTGLSWDGGQMSLSYMRGVNAPCSMLKNRAACAAELNAKNLMPRAMTSKLKPGACTGPYAEASAPDDNPSILSHKVDVVLAADQSPKRKPYGPVACAPMP